MRQVNSAQDFNHALTDLLHCSPMQQILQTHTATPILESETVRSTAENAYYGAKDAFTHLANGSVTGFYMEVIVLRRDLHRLQISLDGLPTHGKRLEKWKLKDLIAAMDRDVNHFLEQTQEKSEIEDVRKSRKIAPSLLRIQGWMMMLMKATDRNDDCSRMKFLIDDWKNNPALEYFLAIEKREPGRPRSLLPPRRKKRNTATRKPQAPSNL